ncbi:hypothetical protein DLAC_08991 [Tieghemostelium lacteum]|uniref:EGF-like domain-containing protein n=1 Tax=Tieghemostelium lacteum TaxID=361077 RepID=A0A151Z8T4_TIELA|nr:hypothetical protein DLAC_08991 [Tieghemostelium lacteum]|eukprot:KYQ90373.1 hypothetical protein DLAC_08991 [Tieghemostelium lacteum]
MIINKIYLTFFLSLLIISLNGQTPPTFYSKIKRGGTSNPDGSCKLTYDFMFSSFNFYYITTAQSLKVFPYGNNILIGGEFSVAEGQMLSFTLTDLASNSYPYSFSDVVCQKNPQPATLTKPYSHISLYHRKSYQPYFFPVILSFNIDLFGLYVYKLLNQTLYTGGGQYDPAIPKTYILSFKWNYPYNNIDNTLKINASEYDQNNYFTFTTSVVDLSVNAPTLISFEHYIESGSFVAQISDPTGNAWFSPFFSKNIFYICSFFPVYGNRFNSTYLGHYIYFNDDIERQIDIAALGYQSIKLQSFNYTTPLKRGTSQPNVSGFNVNTNLKIISVNAVVETQESINQVQLGDLSFVDPLRFQYPYGVTSGIDKKPLTFKSTRLIGQYSKSASVSGYIGESPYSNPYAGFTLDTISPTLTLIEYVPLENTYQVLVRVTASDTISGISKMTFGYHSANPYTAADLVSGNAQNGIYEKIFNVHSSQNVNYITLVDWAANSILVDSGIIAYPTDVFDQSTINVLYFEKNNVDLTVNGTWNTVYFNYLNPDIKATFGFKLISSVERAYKIQEGTLLEPLNLFDMMTWDPTLSLFKTTFYMPPRLFSGPVEYHIMARGFALPPSAFSLMIPTQNSSLIVHSENADEMPPIIHYMRIFPSKDVTATVDNSVTFGWRFRVSDPLNGLESGNISISSEVDRVGYTWTFSPFCNSTDQFDGTYQVSITIDNGKCRSQTYKISELLLRDNSGHFANSSFEAKSIYTTIIANPLMLYRNMSEYEITVSCPENNDNEGPEIRNFNLSTLVIDGSSDNRSLVVSFETYDISGISIRHTPFIYFEGVLGTYVKYPAERLPLLSNETTSVYQTTIQVPYMFGYPNGFGVSVFGISDKLMNLAGYPFGDLADSGYDSIVQVQKIANTPIIESTSSFPKQTLDPLIIYGRSFGTDIGVVIIHVGCGAIVTEYTETDFEVFSSIYIKIKQVNVFGSMCDVTITRDGVISKAITITSIDTPQIQCSPLPVPPDPFPTESPQPTIPSETIPKCPGSPSECSGNGVCIGNVQQSSCQCTKPWSGVDCSYKIFIVPQPTANPNEPNSTIDFTLPATNSQEPSEEAIFYTSLVSILSIREIQIDQTVLHDYTFKEWMYKDISTNQSKIYQYLTNITHEVYKSNTLVNVSIEWFDDYTNISFADQIIQMTPSSIKYRIELSPYQFEKSTNTMDIRFLVSLSSNGSDESCSLQKQGDVFENDFVSLELDNHSFYGRFIKRAVVDGRNRLISNNIESLSQENSESSAIVSIHIPNFEDSAILDPDFSILINHDPITSDTDGSFCKSKENSGLSKTKIAGIVIGCVAFVIIVTIVTVYVLVKKNQQIRMLNKIKQSMDTLTK